MRIRVLVIFVGVVAAVAGRTAAVATADDLQLRLRLRGKGSVSVGHGIAPSFTDTLDGSDHVVRFIVPLVVTDARGTGDGWNVSLTSTRFVTGAGDTLPDDASTIVGVASSCAGTAACTDPLSTATYPLGLPAAATAPPPVVLFDAAVGTGLGAFEVDVSVDLVIPGSAYTGTYKSKLTFAVATGP